jgi:hypothetical protein
VLPREHGAWAILLAPYAIGATAGGLSWTQAAGLVAVLLGFFSRPPLALLLKRRSRGAPPSDDNALLWLNFGLPLAAAVILLVSMMLLRQLWWLPIFGAVALALFLAHALMALRRRERSVPAELLGISLLTLTAPLAYYLGHGNITGEAAMLWLLCAAYFGASVFFVKMKLKAAVAGRRRLPDAGRVSLAASSLLYTAVMAALVLVATSAGWAPPLVPAAFGPVTIYALWSAATLGRQLKIKKEGIVQTALTVLFTGIMVVAYWA